MLAKIQYQNQMTKTTPPQAKTYRAISQIQASMLHLLSCSNAAVRDDAMRRFPGSSFSRSEYDGQGAVAARDRVAVKVDW